MKNEETQTSTMAGGVHSVVARSITKGRRLVVGAGAVAVISLVAALWRRRRRHCGRGTSTSTTKASSVTTAPASRRVRGAKLRARAAPARVFGPPPVRPAASGTIASVAGNVLEVQSPQSGQTTVNVSSKTVITATVSVTESVVVKGTCISATGTKGSGGSVDATTVALFAATKGQCTRGGFGAGGAGGGFRFGEARRLAVRRAATRPRHNLQDPTG